MSPQEITDLILKGKAKTIPKENLTPKTLTRTTRATYRSLLPTHSLQGNLKKDSEEYHKDEATTSLHMLTLYGELQKVSHIQNLQSLLTLETRDLPSPAEHLLNIPFGDYLHPTLVNGNPKTEFPWSILPLPFFQKEGILHKMARHKVLHLAPKTALTKKTLLQPENPNQPNNYPLQHYIQNQIEPEFLRETLTPEILFARPVKFGPPIILTIPSEAFRNNILYPKNILSAPQNLSTKELSQLYTTLSSYFESYHNLPKSFFNNTKALLHNNAKALYHLQFSSKEFLLQILPKKTLLKIRESIQNHPSENTKKVLKDFIKLIEIPNKDAQISLEI